MFCVYCGNEATVKEHVLPLSRWNTIGLNHLKITVPSCFTCNSTAGSKLFLSFEDKREWLFNIARKRNRINLLNLEFIVKYIENITIKINKNKVNGFISVENKCANCGAFLYHRKHKNSKYCSNVCHFQLRSKSRNITICNKM